MRLEPFALTCDSCGEPLLPNVSQADADGCLWICIDPDCAELCAAELETGDLVEGGVPQADPRRSAARCASCGGARAGCRRGRSARSRARRLLTTATSSPEAQDAQRLLAAAALPGAAGHAAADAECLAGIDPELPGLLDRAKAVAACAKAGLSDLWLVTRIDVVDNTSMNLALEATLNDIIASTIVTGRRRRAGSSGHPGQPRDSHHRAQEAARG